MKNFYIIFCCVISLSLASCVDLGVYGPSDDFSSMSVDFISDSIKKNLNVTQIYGQRGLRIDAYKKFSKSDFDLASMQRDFESVNAKCRREGVVLFCDVERSWVVFWPRVRGLKTGSPEVNNVKVSYMFESSEKRKDVEVGVVFIGSDRK